MSDRIANAPAGGDPRRPGRHPPMRRVADFVALFLLASLSCAGRSETRSDVDQQSYSTSVTIVGSRTEATLDRGRAAASEGRFADAAAIFQSVYDMQAAKPRYREEALLGLAQVHANVLNPDRDADKALALYRKLLDEFPDTTKRYEVEQAIAGLEKSSR